MSVCLSISADKSTVIQKSLHEILSPELLLEVARRVGLLKRLKEFNAADYLLTAISLCMTSPKEREYRLVRFLKDIMKNTEPALILKISIISCASHRCWNLPVK